MSGDDNIERELESFLQKDDSRVAALYRKLPRAEPDAKLDAAVLGMARAAVAPNRTRRNWVPAFSAAAVVLFAAGLAFRVGPQVWNDRGEQAKPAAAQDALQKNASPMSESAPAPQSALPAVAPPSSNAKAFPSDSAVNTAKPKSAPEPQFGGNAPARQKEQTGKIVPQPRVAPEELERKRADKPAPVAFPAPATPPPPAQEAPLQSLDSAISQGQREKQEVGADSATSQKPKDNAARSESTRDAISAGASAPAAQPSSARAVSAPAIREQSVAIPDANLYPEHWIANIETLLRKNRRAEAIKSLREFHKKYPDYRLPDDLRDLIDNAH
ncbi:MAG: hypothetical protein ABJB01_08230 [Rudaea sp.]